jgi:hypothetical protein
VIPFDSAQGACECGREQELLDALASDATQQDWSADLRGHAESCAICRDILAVALPLLQDHHATVEGAQPPFSGVVWWRAQMRARQEAARVATRPITLFQGLGAAAAVALVFVLLSAAAPMLSGWFGGLSLFSGMDNPFTFTLPEIDLASLRPSTTAGTLLAAASAACLLLGPLAVYFALSDD